MKVAFAEGTLDACSVCQASMRWRFLVKVRTNIPLVTMANKEATQVARRFARLFRSSHFRNGW